jgi:hypothetical protein
MQQMHQNHQQQLQQHAGSPTSLSSSSPGPEQMAYFSGATLGRGAGNVVSPGGANGHAGSVTGRFRSASSFERATVSGVTSGSGSQTARTPISIASPAASTGHGQFGDEKLVLPKVATATTAAAVSVGGAGGSPLSGGGVSMQQQLSSARSASPLAIASLGSSAPDQFRLGMSPRVQRMNLLAAAAGASSPNSGAVIASSPSSSPLSRALSNNNCGGGLHTPNSPQPPLPPHHPQPPSHGSPHSPALGSLSSMGGGPASPNPTQYGSGTSGGRTQSMPAAVGVGGKRPLGHNSNVAPSLVLRTLISPTTAAMSRTPSASPV